MSKPIGAMGSLEYISTCFAIAGVLFVFTMWEADRYGPRKPYIDTEMNCPSIRVRHSVGGDLKTGVQRVDACSQHLNIKIK